MTVWDRRLLADYLVNLSRALVVSASLLAVTGPPAFFGAPAPTADFAELIRYVFALLMLALPPALFLAALFTVGAVSRRHELMAWRAAGRSRARAVAPAMAVALGALVVSTAWRLVDVVLAIPPTDAAGWTARHAQLAYPLAGPAAAAVGCALGAGRRPRTMYVAFGRALLAIAGFYVLLALTVSLGRHAIWPPAVAGWSATLAFTGLAGVLWWRLDR